MNSAQNFVKPVLNIANRDFTCFDYLSNVINNRFKSQQYIIVYILIVYLDSFLF